MSDSRRKRGSKQIPSTINVSEEDISDPLMQGYLYKQSHIFDATFNKRYFVLYKNCLVYYHSRHEFEKDASHRVLKHRLGFIVLTRLYLTKPEKRPHGGKYCFILHTPDPSNRRKEILLVSANREERRDWMVALQHQNPNLVTPEAFISPESPLPQRKIFPSDNCLSPGEEISRRPSFDATALNVVEEGHSDHDDHEPDDHHEHDEESSGITFSVPSIVLQPSVDDVN